MKIEREYNDVFFFKLCQDSLWLTQKNTFVEINNGEEIFRLKKGKHCFLSDIYSNKYLLIRDKEESYIINKDKKEVFRLVDSDYMSFFDDNVVLIIKYKSQKALLYNFIYKEELISFCKSSEAILYRDEVSVCLMHTGYSFHCFDLENGFLKWGFNSNIFIDESEKFEKYEYRIEKIIGKIENKLWIVLRKGDLIALDIDTGKIIYHLLHPSNNSDYFYTEFGERNHFNINFQITNTGQLVCLDAFYFFCVIEDVENRRAKIEVIDLTEEFDRNELGYAGAPVSFPIIGNYILTAQSGSSDRPFNIGVFNIKTKKIVDRFSLSVGNNTKFKTLIYEHPNVTGLEIFDGKAYVLYGPLGPKKLAVIDLELEKLQKSEII